LLGALGVNVALFALAAYMVNSVAPDQVVEESPSMSLVSLSSQPPPDQEASRDEAQAPPEAEQPEAPRESANEAVAQEMAPAFPSQAQASAASDVGPPDFMGDLSAGGGIGGIAVRVGTGGGGGAPARRNRSSTRSTSTRRRRRPCRSRPNTRSRRGNRASKAMSR
jgi:hypothetical protein